MPEIHRRREPGILSDEIYTPFQHGRIFLTLKIKAKMRISKAINQFDE